MTEPEVVETPYWRLDDDGLTARTGLLRRIAAIPAAAAPVLVILRQAAPRSVLVILVLQLVSGLASAFGLLATTGVLTALLAAGPTPDRVVAALPALVLVMVLYAVRGAMDAGVALANARLKPAVRRIAEERLLAAALGASLSAFDES